MMAGFLRALAVTLGEEGGLADHPADRGGRTNYGVTTSTYHGWLASLGRDPQPVDEITTDEVRQLYHTRFWLEASCDAFPWPLSLCVFEAAVNHGTHNGKRLVQRALGVADDGKVGPITKEAAGTTDPVAASLDMLWERASFFARIVEANRSQSVFIDGWIMRLRHLRDVVLNGFHPEDRAA